MVEEIKTILSRLAVLPSDPRAPKIVNYVVGKSDATGTALRDTAFDN